LTEGLENRFQRHLAMRDRVITWAQQHDFGLLAPEGFRSPTVTCLSNNPNIEIDQLNKYLRSQGMIISNGYGSLKEKTFRIAHMGDTTMADLDQLLSAIDDIL
jgi:aspartate aminotransferase-like enzyme